MLTNDLFLKKFLVIFFMIYPVLCWGQVEHNFPVAPQHITCDSLKALEDLGQDPLLQLQETNFRFTQKFDIPRPEGIQAGKFFSCDGQDGYLYIKVESQQHIYEKVPKYLWDKMLGSMELGKVYKNDIEGHYRSILLQ